MIRQLVSAVYRDNTEANQAMIDLGTHARPDLGQINPGSGRSRNRDRNLSRLSQSPSAL